MANNILHLNEKDFDSTIASGVTLVDFFADWCGPCKMLMPTIEKVAEALDGKAKVAKVNVDEAESIALRFGIMSIPTLMVYKNGELQEKLVGIKPTEILIQMVQKYL